MLGGYLADHYMKLIEEFMALGSLIEGKVSGSRAGVESDAVCQGLRCASFRRTDSIRT